MMILFLTIASALYALDEETYARLSAETVIAAHQYKGNVPGMNQWISRTQQQYPVFMSGEWQTFERNLAANSANKSSVYTRILNIVRSKGYNARISSLGSGMTSIEIMS